MLWLLRCRVVNSMGDAPKRLSRSHPRRSIAPRAIARTVAHPRMGTVGCRMDLDQPHAAVQLERGAAQAFRGALAPEGTACPNKQRAAAGSAAALTELTELRESSHGHSPCTQRRAKRNALRRIRLRRAAQPFCSSLPVPIHRLRSSRAKPRRGRTINRPSLLAVVGAGCAGHCAPQRPQGAAVRLVPRRRAGADLVPARALRVMLSAARSLSRRRPVGPLHCRELRLVDRLGARGRPHMSHSRCCAALRGLASTHAAVRTG